MNSNKTSLNGHSGLGGSIYDPLNPSGEIPGGGNNSGSGSGSGSGSSFNWNQFLNVAANFSTDLLNSFLVWDTTNNKNEIIQEQSEIERIIAANLLEAQKQKDILIDNSKPPVSAGMDLITILITIGVLAGVGSAIWFAMKKNNEPKHIEASATKASK
jgi:hypothetical protein